MIGAFELVDERLVRPDLSNAEARRGTILRTTIEEGRMTGFDCPEGLLRDVTFTGCRLDLAAFPLARLERVRFEDCRLEEADFREARLKQVRFERCDLSRADVTKARFDRCELVRCKLEGLRGAASLGGVAMTWDDVVAGAGLWASALGITLVEEE
jgi:uncharacterized protein YjbI with pentapeptide repeats